VQAPQSAIPAPEIAAPEVKASIVEPKKLPAAYVLGLREIQAHRDGIFNSLPEPLQEHVRKVAKFAYYESNEKSVEKRAPPGSVHGPTPSSEKAQLTCKHVIMTISSFRETKPMQRLKLCFSDYENWSEPGYIEYLATAQSSAE
jgi:hypothetical protein